MDEGDVFEEVAAVGGGQLVVHALQLREVRLVGERLGLLLVYVVVLERQLVEFPCVVTVGVHELIVFLLIRKC